MKKIYGICMIVALSALSACSDFLDVNDKKDLTNVSFWQTEQHVLQGLTATYAALQSYDGDKWNFFEEVYIGLTYRADDIDNNKSQSYGQKLASFTSTTEESTGYKLWLTCYAGIARANQVIQQTPQVKVLSDAAMNAYIGEAKFLRALNYFFLVCSFENVPKVTTFEGDLNKLLPAQAPQAEIWALIEEDLQAAEKYLPESYADEWAGRATKWTAKAMLAKVYLFEEKWTAAEDKFRDVVDNGPYALLSNYADNFNGLGENGSESVFEIQFSGDRNGGVDERHPINWEISPGALDGWELFYPSEWLMSEMMNDKTPGGEYSARVYESVFFDDPSSQMRPPTGTNYVPYADVKSSLTYPYYFKKYNAWSDRQGSYVGTNVSIMRFADVLLMYAEALNENGKTAQAIDEINKVRTRSGAAPLSGMTKDQLRQQIRHHERPVELAMEYAIRWLDLYRWSRGNTVKESVKATLMQHNKPFVANFIEGKHEINPIPYQEIILNRNLVQSDNW
ncbi:MAG: RagB/SusD family nutrient uptake outer membrane protein [Bacteroidota bacterium]